MLEPPRGKGTFAQFLRGKHQPALWATWTCARYIAGTGQRSLRNLKGCSMGQGWGFGCGLMPVSNPPTSPGWTASQTACPSPPSFSPSPHPEQPPCQLNSAGAGAEHWGLVLALQHQCRCLHQHHARSTGAHVLYGMCTTALCWLWRGGVCGLRCQLLQLGRLPALQRR